MRTVIILTVDLDSLWDFNDAAGSEERFVSWISQPNLTNADRAEALTQLARSRGLQSRFDEAHATLDEASGLIAGADGRAKVRCLLERGRAFNSSGDKVKALALFHEAAALAAKVGEEGLEIDALHMVAIADDPAKSAEHNRAVIRRATASQDPAARKWLASLNNNLGWSLFEAGKLHEALQCFQDALAAREAQDDEQRTAIAKWCVARGLRELGREDEALSMQEGLAISAPNGYVYEELAILYSKKGDARAATNALSALKKLEADTWFVENEAPRIKALRDLAN